MFFLNHVFWNVVHMNSRIHKAKLIVILFLDILNKMHRCILLPETSPKFQLYHMKKYSLWPFHFDF